MESSFDFTKTRGISLSGDERGMRFVTRQLLGLPGGLHFSRITVLCIDKDVDSTTDLLSRCSDTLKFLKICYFTGTFPPASVTE